MPSKSTYFSNQFLNFMFGKTTYTPPDVFYIGLLITIPNESYPVGQEAAGVNYSRVAVINNTTNWPSASNKTKSNGTPISFSEIGAGGWGLINGYGIYDSIVAGNLIYYGLLSEPLATQHGDSVQFGINKITIIEN